MDKYDFSLYGNMDATPQDVRILVHRLSAYGIVIFADHTGEYVDILMETSRDQFERLLRDYGFPPYCTPELYRITIQ